MGSWLISSNFFFKCFIFEKKKLPFLVMLSEFSVFGAKKKSLKCHFFTYHHSHKYPVKYLCIALCR